MKGVPPKSLLDSYQSTVTENNDKVLSSLIKRDEAKDAWRRLSEICSDELYEKVAVDCYHAASVWVKMKPENFSKSLSKKEAIQLAKSLRLLSDKLSEKEADVNMIHLLTEEEKIEIRSHRIDAENDAFLSGMDWNFKGSPTDEDPEALHKDNAFAEWERKQAISRPDSWELNIPYHCQKLLPANISLSELMIRHAEGLEAYSKKKKREYHHEDELRTKIIRALHSVMMVYFDQPHNAIVCGLAIAVLNDDSIDESTIRGCVRNLTYPYWFGVKVRWHKSDKNS